MPIQITEMSQFGRGCGLPIQLTGCRSQEGGSGLPIQLTNRSSERTPADPANHKSFLKLEIFSDTNQLKRSLL